MAKRPKTLAKWTLAKWPQNIHFTHFNLCISQVHIKNIHTVMYRISLRWIMQKRTRENSPLHQNPSQQSSLGLCLRKYTWICQHYLWECLFCKNSWQTFFVYVRHFDNKRGLVSRPSPLSFPVSLPLPIGTELTSGIRIMAECFDWTTCGLQDIDDLPLAKRPVSITLTVQVAWATWG